MVAKVKTYRVEADRDGRFWHIRVPEIRRSTQARNLREIEPMARDLIAIMDDVPAGSFAVDVRIALPEDVRRELETARDLRNRAAHAKSEAAAITRTAARQLHDQGVPLRDIGQLLDVSYQRAHQLVREASDAA
ncbi:MAG: hypothetical protein J2P32_11755 [Actinobacteria bacterium]|nr:hypothetical protein [Actinomycetota bacterium]